MAEYKSPQTEPGNEQRFLLVILTMAAVIFGSQFLLRKFAPQPPASNPAQKQAASQQAAQPAPTPSQSAATAPAKTPAVSPQAPKKPAETKQAASESEIVVENHLYRITLTNHGAQATHWV